MKTNAKPCILVTRSRGQASDLADRLTALGTRPILIPAIETIEPLSFDVLDGAIGVVESFHWLIFTSANAVQFLRHRLQQTEQEIQQNREFQAPEIAAIGPATARALETLGLKPTLLPPQAVAESLATALLPHARQPDGSPTRFLLVRAQEARDHLPETLRAAGAEVTIAPAYRTVIPPDSIPAIRSLFSDPATYPDAITFTSSSTARNLFALLESAGICLPTAEADPPGPVLASIGPITSATLRELGYPPQLESSQPDVPTLAENLVKYLGVWKSL